MIQDVGGTDNRTLVISENRAHAELEVGFPLLRKRLVRYF